MMRSCKEISALVSQGFDRPLTWRERWAMRVHFWYCAGCMRFATQLRWLRTVAGAWEQHTEEHTPPPLSVEARARIARAVSEANPHSDPND